MDKNKIEEQYFIEFIQSTRCISDWRQKNNIHIFSIFKYTVLISFANIATLLVSNNYQCILKLLLFIINLFSIFVAFIWYKINNNYKNINKAKFKVIEQQCIKNGITSYFHEEYDLYSIQSNSSISKWENLLIFSIPILLSICTILIVCFF